MQITSGIVATGATPCHLPVPPAFHIHADSILRQTVGGSIASSVNDPVGEWTTIVGTAPTQAIAGKRPLIKTVGGKRYVAGTGDTDKGCLTIPVGSLGVANPLTIFLSVVIPAGGSDGAIFKLQAEGDASSLAFGVGAGSTLDSGLGFNVIALREAIAWIPAGLAITADTQTPIVVTIPTTGSITMYTPGGSGGTATWTMPAASSYAVSILGYERPGTLRYSLAHLREMATWNSILSAGDITTLLGRNL